MAYLDTSILGSYYCRETLSAAVNVAVGSISEIIISTLGEVEFCSLLSLKVRTGAIDRPSANISLAQFQVHLVDGHYQVLEIGSREFQLARNWLARFDTPLRSLDALHLATAFAHRLEIWTTDKKLARAARQVGAKCRLVA